MNRRTWIKRVVAAVVAIACSAYAWHVYSQTYGQADPGKPPGFHAGAAPARPATRPSVARKPATRPTNVVVHRAPPDPFNLNESGSFRRLEGHTDTLRCVALSPDKSKLLSAGNDRTIRLWDFATGQELRKFEGHGGYVLSVGFSSDGKRIISSSEDTTIRVWDANTGEQLSQLDGHQSGVIGAAFLADSNLAVSASHDGTVRLWDIDKETTIQKVDYHHRLCSLGMSVPSNLMAVGTHFGHVYIWDIKARSQIRELETLPNCIDGLVFTPDGKRLIISVNRGTFRIIDVGTGAKVFEEDDEEKVKAHNIALSSDGRYLALAGFPRVSFYDLQTLKPCKTHMTSGYFAAHAMCFVPDSSLLVTGGGGILDSDSRWMAARRDKLLVWNLPQPLP